MEANFQSHAGTGTPGEGENPDGTIGKDRLAWYFLSVDLFHGNSTLVANTGFRCDSAKYLKGGKGCAFDYGVTVWPLIVGENGKTHNWKTKDVAQHIYDATTNPNSTIPRKEGTKEIPGAPKSMTPLTRTRDANQIDQNRGRSIGACKAEWGDGYSEGNTYQCDEFPMASTNQGADSGANKEENNFSVRVLPREENEGAGRFLGWWYKNYRIVDNDAFWVVVRL